MIETMTPPPTTAAPDPLSYPYQNNGNGHAPLSQIKHLTPHNSEDSDDLEPFSNRKRWTWQECEQLERYGFLPERYELIDGEILLRMAQYEQHGGSVIEIIGCLLNLFNRKRVRTQVTVEIVGDDTSRPEPDVVVYEQEGYVYGKMPKGSDVLFAAEVSQSTLGTDMKPKAALYARAGIPEYWVLDIKRRRMVVHRDPQAWQYNDVVVYGEDAEITLQSEPEHPVLVADLLPPVQSMTEEGED